MIRRLFEREVDYLWSRLERAARGREALAPLWSRDGDARVTRLVQSAAYAFARVKEKLEDDVPEISHALLASALPEVIRPFPSATVVQLRDDLKTRRTVTEGGVRSIASRAIDGAPCVFRTAWPHLAAPLTLERAAVQGREAGVQFVTLRIASYPGQPISAAIPNALRVFVQTADPYRALDIVQAACATPAPVLIRALAADGGELGRREARGASVQWSALAAGVPHFGPADRFRSGTALRTFFAFPEAFGFFDVCGLREAASGVAEAATSLEILIPLHGEIEEECFAAEFHLDCAPALNVFDAETAPLAVRSLGPCGTLAVAGRAAREVFHITRIRVMQEAAPDRPLDVRVWESERARPCLDDELYVRLERRAAVDRGSTELRAELLRPSGKDGVPRGSLLADVLATDGSRTESLLRGDLVELGDALQIANITRVTRPRDAVLDGRLPWRINAYARMPASRFAHAGSLAAYLDIHDVTQTRAHVAPGAPPADAGVLAVSRQPAERVLGSAVHHGESVELALDPAVFGGTGATWLVGELLARALAERTDFLRFSRTRLVSAGGNVVADYGNRSGERLPPPFG
jgi:type VI secretion system protein ImpG